MKQAKFEMEHNDNIEVTMTLTMSVGEWEQLVDQLKESSKSTQWPSWKFIAAVKDMIRDYVYRIECVYEEKS